MKRTRFFFMIEQLVGIEVSLDRRRMVRKWTQKLMRLRRSAATVFTDASARRDGEASTQNRSDAVEPKVIEMEGDQGGRGERTGFIDAPLIGPAKIASRAITAPTAIPAVIPFSFAPVDTLRIVSIRKKVSSASRTKDCHSEPAGMVAPSSFL